MTVRIYEKRKSNRNWIHRFLSSNHVQHEMIDPTELGNCRKLTCRGELAAVEVDGRLIFNPNEDALKKLLDL
jgi:hypothetical protein